MELIAGQRLGHNIGRIVVLFELPLGKSSFGHLISDIAPANLYLSCYAAVRWARSHDIGGLIVNPHPKTSLHKKDLNRYIPQSVRPCRPRMQQHILPVQLTEPLIFGFVIFTRSPLHTGSANVR